MNLEQDAFYFFSTEEYSRELPVEAHFVKRLITSNNREAILIKCKRKLNSYGTAYLVLVPRLTGTSFYDLGSSEQVFAHVLNGSNKVNEGAIDLTAGSRLIIDIGGISFDPKVAERWQPRKHND